MALGILSETLNLTLNLSKDMCMLANYND